MVRNSKIRSRMIQKKIFNSTVAWMKGEKTTYQVAKEAKVDWMTAKKWLDLFSNIIEQKKIEIPEMVINHIKSLEAHKGTPLWIQIKNQIVKMVLSKKASLMS